MLACLLACVCVCLLLSFHSSLIISCHKLFFLIFTAKKNAFPLLSLTRSLSINHLVCSCLNCFCWLLLQLHLHLARAFASHHSVLPLFLCTIKSYQVMSRLDPRALSCLFFRSLSLSSLFASASCLFRLRVCVKEPFSFLLFIFIWRTKAVELMFFFYSNKL